MLARLISLAGVWTHFQRIRSQRIRCWRSRETLALPTRRALLNLWRRIPGRMLCSWWDFGKACIYDCLTYIHVCMPSRMDASMHILRMYLYTSMHTCTHAFMHTFWCIHDMVCKHKNMPWKRVYIHKYMPSSRHAFSIHVQTRHACMLACVPSSAQSCIHYACIHYVCTDMPCMLTCLDTCHHACSLPSHQRGR